MRLFCLACLLFAVLGCHPREAPRGSVRVLATGRVGGVLQEPQDKER